MLSLLPFSRQHSRFVWNNTVCFCFGLKMITFHFYQIYREILAFTSLTWILCLTRLNQDRHSGHTRAVHTILLSGKDSGCTAVHMDKGSTIHHSKHISDIWTQEIFVIGCWWGDALICCPDGLWPPVRALCENTPPTLQLLPDMAGTACCTPTRGQGSLSLSEIVLCKHVAIYLQHSTLCVNPSHCGLILLTRSVIMSIHCN